MFHGEDRIGSMIVAFFRGVSVLCLEFFSDKFLVIHDHSTHGERRNDGPNVYLLFVATLF